MKKSIIFGLAALAIMAFAVLPAIAGQNCGDKTATTTTSKSACTAGKEATMAGSKTDCATAHGTNATTASAKDCEGCPHAGNCETITMSVKGMTCTGCENGLTTALQGTDGVLKVVKVSHTDNTAVVCVDPSKCKTETLTKLITSKGYQAEVIPAVATTANATHAGDKAACATMSKEDCAKVCGDKAAAACTDKKKEEVKKTDGSL